MDKTARFEKAMNKTTMVINNDKMLPARKFQNSKNENACLNYPPIDSQLHTYIS